jgi:hypothetical protein
MLDKLIQYEQENLTETETIELFQELIDTGLAWKLQGSYGRMAMFLVETGVVTLTPHPQSKQ